MPKTVTKTVIVEWVCDWCNKTLIRDDEEIPEGWEDNFSSDHDGVFCCTEHYSESKRAWEETFEDSFDLRVDAYQELKAERNAT